MAVVVAMIRFYSRCFVFLAVGVRRLLAFLTSSHSSALGTSRFAQAHETARLASAEFEELQTALLLGRSHFNRIAAVRPAKRRPELGNLLSVAPPRMGKSKAAIAELLNFQHSIAVLDVKKELYNATAGYRSTLGPVFVSDFQGFGNAYNPLHDKTTEDALYSQAVRLLYETNERDPIYA